MLFIPAVGCALVLPAVGYALSVLLIFSCCWVCSSRGLCTRVASFLLLTTDSLAVVLSLIPPASLCGSLRFQHHYSALRHFVIVCFAEGALVPRIRSLQQCILLTMRTGFSFACYFSFTCSAEMSVSLFTGCVHLHKVRVFIAASNSRQQ